MRASYRFLSFSPDPLEEHWEFKVSKYEPLGDYLKSQDRAVLRLSFKEIEKIIGQSLPNSANTPQFWANVDRHSPSRRHQWMHSGYLAFYEPVTESVRFERGSGVPPSGATHSGNIWSVTELRACVEAYRLLLDAEEEGAALSKTKVRNKTLDARLVGRTAGAYEYRMQNISAVLIELGLPTLVGYKPMRNVGASKNTLISLIKEVWKESGEATMPTDDFALFESRAARLADKYADGDFPPPQGQQKVGVSSRKTRQFSRDPNVAAWVRSKAKGRCEACLSNAPFKSADGLPYLEVHHLRPLSEGGPDTTNNAVAICPNCHRELHSGSDKEEIRATLIKRVDRLHEHPKKVV